MIANIKENDTWSSLLQLMVSNVQALVAEVRLMVSNANELASTYCEGA